MNDIPHMSQQLAVESIMVDRHTLQIVSSLGAMTATAVCTYAWFSPLGLKNHAAREMATTTTMLIRMLHLVES